jgi:hypothetical protein
MTKGYFGASALPGDIEEAVARLTVLGNELSTADGDPVLFMNGVDHALPDANTGAACEALAAPRRGGECSEGCSRTTWR